jgi:hypothetical protein
MIGDHIVDPDFNYNIYIYIYIHYVTLSYVRLHYIYTYNPWASKLELNSYMHQGYVSLGETSYL